jgi:uncharacterized protein YceK
MGRSLGIAIIAVLVISQAGCGTVMNFSPKVESSQREEIGRMRIYGGVRIDAQTLSEAAWPWQKLLTLLVLTVEFPLSLVMDTVTLPVTIPVTLSR